MPLSTQPYKGTRDFYPEDMRLRKWMFGVMREVCESYGYEEYDGPVLEPLEIYAAKTSEEIVNEQSFSFTDRGGRKVVMRPEMTPTVSRMVAARRQELGYPLRLYSIPNFFRYERPQKGRLREFWQLNADIFGVEGAEADVEIIQLADSIMKAFGAEPGNYEVKINSRKATEELLEKRGFSKQLAPKVISVMDKLEKPKAYEKQLSTFDSGTQQRIVQFVDSMKRKGSEVADTEPGRNLVKVIDSLRRGGVEVKADLSLARGFDYYTDVVFEVFDKNPENNRSMFGGGRYDGLVGEFGVEPVPTVGFGMGDATLVNFLEANELIPDLKPSNQLVIVGIGVENSKLSEVAGKIRAQKVNVSVDYTNRKLDKKIKAAEKLGVENILFIGEEELGSGEFSLKDLNSGRESKVTIEKIPGVIKG